MFASQSFAARAFVSRVDVATGCVGIECEAATSKEKRSTTRPVHRKGRPSSRGWRAVPPIPPLKDRVRGEALTLYSASMCRNGTFFPGTLLFNIYIYIYRNSLNLLLTLIFTKYSSFVT